VTDGWRPILAVLANPAARSVFAEAVVDGRHQPPTGVRRARAEHQLVAAGLLVADAAGTLVVNEALLRSLLAEGAPRPRTGPERFVNHAGRIDQYPASATERHQLFAWIAERALEPDEVLDEREVGDRLERFTDDVATLRRYLVEHEVLVREPDGSAYRRAPVSRG